ncbi:MAG: hypothetical protein O7G88_00620, partial [bacterium]|nr:hypothetical protein [bacterium]
PRRGALWGPPLPHPWAVSTAAPELPDQPVQSFTPTALARALHDLDTALADSANPAYRRRLIAHLLPLAMSHTPRVGEALSVRLNHSLPETPVPLFGGQIRVPAAQVARWYLLHAIAMNGHGRVPTRFLTWPWTAAPNQAEKYLEPAVAAAWAVAQLEQSDRSTLAALDTALSGDLPDWARGDLLAALHTLDTERKYKRHFRPAFQYRHQ